MILPEVQISGEVAAAVLALLAFFRTLAIRRMNTLARVVKKIDRRLGRLENHFGTCTVTKGDIDADADEAA
jgi:predicted mannosyl-3-phosphoglycerate phosphatase (HAD superfamily)